MSQVRSFGLQWRLAVIYLAVGATGSAATLFVYKLLRHYAFSEPGGLALGMVAGILVGLAGAVIGSLITRSVKLRLWEAGQMAGRIARGDYLVRLEAGPEDEVGWLELQLNQMAGQLQTAVGSLKELAEQNRLLGEEAGRGAALEERMRLARDLHDTVNQQLFVLSMRIAAVKRRLEQVGGEAAALEPELKDLEDLARQAHNQIRELILQIRPVTLAKEGLGEALKDYLNSTAERENWSLKDQIEQIERPGELIEESLFRIAQESLNNISKHAAAKNVVVKLFQDDQGSIKLVISDDGVGFDPKNVHRPTAVGLSGIRERAAGIGGSMTVISSQGQGTELTVLVPLKKKGVKKK